MNPMRGTQTRTTYIPTRQVIETEIDVVSSMSEREFLMYTRR